jgi:hypothetical protein
VLCCIDVGNMLMYVFDNGVMVMMMMMVVVIMVILI